MWDCWPLAGGVGQWHSAHVTGEADRCSPQVPLQAALGILADWLPGDLAGDCGAVSPVAMPLLLREPGGVTAQPQRQPPPGAEGFW